MHFRLFVAIMIFTMTAACGSADAAGVTMRYLNPDYPDDGMTIVADGDGHIRATENNGQELIVDGDDIWVVTADEYGTSRIGLDDYLSVAGDIRQFYVDEGLLPAEPDDAFRVGEGGEQTVGEWRGTAYSLEFAANPSRVIEVVVSDDPELAEAGAVARRVFALYARMQSSLFTFPPGYLDAWQGLYARGMPLRSEMWVLDSVEYGPVPAESFALPDELITRDELAERARRRIEQR